MKIPFTYLCMLAAVSCLFYSVFVLPVAGHQIFNEVDTALVADAYRRLDHGMKVLLGSIVLGVLAEISFSLRNGS